MKKPFIIAEIGSNCFKYHDLQQNFDLAVRQIGGARESGCDAVKFQMFTAAELWGPTAKKTVFADLQDRYALPLHWVRDLARVCRGTGLEFMCSAFSVKGFMHVAPYVKRHKLASPEIRSADIYNYLFEEQSKPVIFSLGCVTSSNLDKVMSKVRKGDVVLECVSNYPARFEDYNFYNMYRLAQETKQKWGISDHTPGSQLAKTARAHGADYFEKHVDFCKFVDGETPDSGVSINGDTFKRYVEDIQDQEIVDHDSHKRLAAHLYARRKYKGGWFRPFPEGAPGVD